MAKENIGNWIAKEKKIKKILNKNNNKKIRKPVLFSLFFVLGCLVAFALVFTPSKNTQGGRLPQLVLAENVLAPQGNDAKKNIASFASAAIEKLDGLPVESIEKHDVENAWGTAVYLPQTHRNPGSSVADASNDSARVAQEELYQVAKDLHEKYGIEMIMAEGEFYGPADQKGVDALAGKIKAKKDFADRAKALGEIMEKENVDPSYRQAFAAKTKSTIDSLDREIALQGAAYKLVAEGEHNDIKLYGSENRDTFEQSADIVRNYIYEQDRMGQLNSGTSRTTAGLPNSMAAMMALLGRSNNPALNENDFKTLENYASQCKSAEMNKTIDDLRQAYIEIGNIRNQESINSQAPVGSSSSPSRSDNPYTSISDPGRLKIEIAKTEQQIQDVVINRRNRETAENFADALKKEGLTAGMLQFGAGHEDGLVKELNNQGLNVVVITTKEVAKGELREENSQAPQIGQNSSGMRQGAVPQDAPESSGAPTGNPFIGRVQNQQQMGAVVGGGMTGIPGSASSALLKMIRGMNGSSPTGI